jgi:hypothetical protein
VVLSGQELAARMAAYWRFRMHEVRDAMGRSAADHIRERYGAAAQVPEADLPADLSEADTVGVVYDEVEGNYFWADFGVVRETFADPALAARRRHREAVLGYLESPTISPLAFRRLAEPDPERASRVFRRVLKRPGFSWGTGGAVAAVQGELVRAAGAAQCHADQPGAVRPLPAGFPADQRREAKLTGGQ